MSSWALTLLVLLVASSATAQSTASVPAPAPFGLTWLLALTEVKARGIELGNPEAGRFGQSCLASGLPRQFDDQSYTVLSFGYDDRLVRITAVGGEFASDHDLTRVRKRYAEVAEILEMKYGEGKVDENIDPVWSGRNAIGGLNHGKNWLYRIFDADGIHIELSVFAESGATTNWRLIFEHVEGMKSLLAERRRREAATL